MRKLLVLALVLAWAGVAHGHSSQGFDPAPSCTVANMLQGRCGSSAGDRVWVVDAVSTSSCSTGGGTFQHECTRQVDGTWSFPVGGGLADISSITDSGNLCDPGEHVFRKLDDSGFDCTAAGGGIPILIDGGAPVDAPLGINFIGGVGVDITPNAASNPETATFFIDWTEVSAAIPDSALSSNYSGISVGACPSGGFVTTLNDNAAPTCAQAAFGNVTGSLAATQLFDNDTTAGQCLLSGGAGGPPAYGACPGSGSTEFSTLTDTGNLCDPNEVVVRDAGDSGFDCVAAPSVGSPTGAKYVVGELHAGLSAEIAPSAANQVPISSGTTDAAWGTPAFTILSGTASLAQLPDDATASLCLLSGGAGGDPAYGSCSAGTGDIATVGDCDGSATGGVCFTGIASSGTTLTFATTQEGIAGTTDGTITLKRNDATNASDRLILLMADNSGITHSAIQTQGAGTLTIGGASAGPVTINADQTIVSDDTGVGKVKLMQEVGDGSFGITIAAPGAGAAPTLTGNLDFILPETAGLSGQQLTTNGSGLLSWAAAAGAITVGNCTSSPCFTAAGTGSLLEAPQSLDIALDQAAPSGTTRTLRVLDGADAPTFTVDEIGNVQFIGQLATAGALAAITAVVASPTTSTTDYDVPATAGAIRLENNKTGMCWRNGANTTNVCMSVDASDFVQVTGGTAPTQALLDINDVGWSAYKLSVDGVTTTGLSPLFIDQDKDGSFEPPNDVRLLSTNSSDGSVQVNGSLTVVEDFTVTGVPEPMESVLYRFRLAADSIPNTDDCWPMIGPYESRVSASTADPGGRCRSFLPFDTMITNVCVTITDGTMPASGTCTLEMYEHGERTTPGPFASFQINTASLNAVGEYECDEPDNPINSPASPSPASLYLQAKADTCNPATNWPEIEVVVQGYRTTVP